MKEKKITYEKLYRRVHRMKETDRKEERERESESN